MYIIIRRSKLCTYVPLCTSAAAILWGDPHINTLDGARYTFNGKGEFTILETDDDSFVVQGRLEQATDESGMPVQATVFTAIVAKTSTSDVVQMEVNAAGGIEVRVNRALLNFSILSSQQFVGVEVTEQVDNTYQASFGGNYVVQVSGDNGILSLLRVAPPTEAMRRTRGLLGNFNGDPSDDLIPRMASVPIPTTSTIEEIHNQFGLTCEFSLKWRDICMCTDSEGGECREGRMTND